MSSKFCVMKILPRSIRTSNGEFVLTKLISLLKKINGEESNHATIINYGNQINKQENINLETMTNKLTIT